MAKHEIIEQLLEQRTNVMKAMEGLSDQEICQPLEQGKWSVKDTLGHLAAWEGEVVNAFEQKARGERPTIGDITDFNSWNDVQWAKRKDRTPDQIREELNENRKKLLTIIQTLPDDAELWSPQRSTAKMLGMLIEHDKHHWQKICAYRRLECG